VNSLDWRGRPEPVETLRDYGDLLRFMMASGALDPSHARTLFDWGERHPKRAARALERAKATREAIARLVKEISAGRRLPREDVERLEQDCRKAMETRSLVPGPKAMSWQWKGYEMDPDRPRWIAALDAERLLTDTTRSPIRECEGNGCGWFFLDKSRNRRKRWCSMDACGNRAKAQRFYRKKRSASGSPSHS
jgi:predicted RNA-binding Zn ribbon-like protein